MTERCPTGSCEQAEAIAEATIRKTFTALGVDVNSPDDIRHFQANMAFLFRFRRLSEKVGMMIILTIVTVITGGVVKLVLESLKSNGGQ